jgi:hypothetical protein
MGAHILSHIACAQQQFGPARTLRCDHCREELALDVQCYWHPNEVGASISSIHFA